MKKLKVELDLTGILRYEFEIEPAETVQMAASRVELELVSKVADDASYILSIARKSFHFIQENS